MNNGLVYFQSGQGSAASSGEFVKDAFQDITLLATNNTGLTSTASTNPLSQYFANDDLPRYGVKTLWIDDLVQLDPREWIDNKPTYKIIWHDNYSAAYGYVVGNVRIRNVSQGKVLEIKNIGDIFGVTGPIRKALFLCGVSGGTGTADIVVDGTDTTVDADFGSAASDSLSVGYRKYNGFVSGSSNETEDLHDYRLTANESDTLIIAGIVVYHENSSADIECFPGNTYLNKEKKTSSAASALGFTSITSQNGANTIIYKTSGSGYDYSIVESPTQQSIGIGSSGTNQIQVTTGHGGSFLQGDGIVVGSGSTFYIGAISSISTDTFTVGPTLAFGVSNTLYRAWAASATAIIGSTLYSLNYTLDPAVLQVLGNEDGFGIEGQDNYAWQNKEGSVRAWGKDLKMSADYGFEGIAYASTAGFLQVDGRFQAAEIEVAGSGRFDVSIGVNGTSAFSINEGFTGVKKYTVFTDAQVGWNSFVISQGASFGTCTINKINLYGLQNPGITFGRLAQFSDIGDLIPRGTLGATVSSLGAYERVYCDSLFLEGPWDRGRSVTACGGVNYIGSTTTCVLNFQWYGKDIALLGTAASAATLVIDGAGVANTFNSKLSIASEGFHTLSYTVGGSATCVIEAIEYDRTRTEFESLKNDLPNGDPLNQIRVYEQSTTPILAYPGTIWGQDPEDGGIWMYLFDRWYQLNISAVSDNPNVGNAYYYGGAS